MCFVSVYALQFISWELFAALVIDFKYVPCSFLCEAVTQPQASKQSLYSISVLLCDISMLLKMRKWAFTAQWIFHKKINKNNWVQNDVAIRLRSGEYTGR